MKHGQFAGQTHFSLVKPNLGVEGSSRAGTLLQLFLHIKESKEIRSLPLLEHHDCRGRISRFQLVGQRRVESLVHQPELDDVVLAAKRR